MTNAALYYHFKTNKDILHSFTDDYLAELDAFCTGPRTGLAARTRRELLDRYVGIVLASSDLPLPRAEPGLGAVHGAG